MKIIFDGIEIERAGKLVTMTFCFDTTEEAEEFKKYMEAASEAGIDFLKRGPPH